MYKSRVLCKRPVGLHLALVGLLLLLMLFLQSKYPMSLKQTMITRQPSIFNHYSDFIDVRHAQEEIFRLLTTPTTDCNGFLKVIKKNAADYELCNSDRYGPKSNHCLVYSFGIGKDTSFDDFMHEKFSCDVRMFDPTIKQKTREIKPNMMFYDLGVSGKNEWIGPNGIWELKKVSEIRKLLGHNKRTLDVVKIDVEGYEWGVLRELIESHTIYDIRQMLVELHTPTHKQPMTINDYVEACNILYELNRAGFEIFKYHNNNCCAAFVPFVTLPGRKPACCYEVFYVNTRYV